MKHLILTLVLAFMPSCALLRSGQLDEELDLLGRDVLALSEILEPTNPRIASDLEQLAIVLSLAAASFEDYEAGGTTSDEVLATVALALDLTAGLSDDPQVQTAVVLARAVLGRLAATLSTDL